MMSSPILKSRVELRTRRQWVACRNGRLKQTFSKPPSSRHERGRYSIPKPERPLFAKPDIERRGRERLPLGRKLPSLSSRQKGSFGPLPARNLLLANRSRSLGLREMHFAFVLWFRAANRLEDFRSAQSWFKFAAYFVEWLDRFGRARCAEVGLYAKQSSSLALARGAGTPASSRVQQAV